MATIVITLSTTRGGGSVVNCLWSLRTVIETALVPTAPYGNWHFSKWKVTSPPRPPQQQQYILKRFGGMLYWISSLSMWKVLASPPCTQPYKKKWWCFLALDDLNSLICLELRWHGRKKHHKKFLVWLKHNILYSQHSILSRREHCTYIAIQVVWIILQASNLWNSTINVSETWYTCC